MSGVVALGLLWGAVGISLGIRWWTEREQASEHHAGREGAVLAATGASSTRFGRATESRAEHRRQAMLGAYAVGTSLVAIGFLLEATLPLALGAALVNLGTLYRYLVLLLDEALFAEPDVDRVAASEVVRPAHRRARQPIVSRVLVGDLAK
jgi:hypothetical protein